MLEIKSNDAESAAKIIVVGVGGAIGSLFNPLGTAVGIATGINGKHGKTKFICQKCGKVFERKV